MFSHSWLKNIFKICIIWYNKQFPNYSNYSKEELVGKINKLHIYNVANSIITKYDGRIISTSDVSDRYEIFDIKS